MPKLIFSLIAASALLPLRAATAAEYTFATLPIPGYAATNAYGIDNAGAVVVSALPAQDSFLRDPSGGYTAVAYPGRAATVALGINNFGTVVGDVWNPGTNSYIGFVRAPDGQYADFAYPGAFGPAGGMQANAVNDLGVIVGGYAISATDGGAFVRSPTGYFQTFRYMDDARTMAYGVNILGQISGQSRSGSFLRKADGGFVSIQVAGAGQTQAFGINNAGCVVGSYLAEGVHGFVRDADGTFHTIDVPGARATQAWAVNDLGQIAGTAWFGDQAVGFIATPVPEPAALILPGGLLLCLARTRRR